MNLFDYALIAIVGLSVVLSLWRGFVREVISIIGLVAAFFAASRASGKVGNMLGDWITNETAADIAGFALVFVIVIVLVALVGSIIRKLVDMADLTTTDRTLGVFFGLARGLLLIGLCFLIYTSYTRPDKTWLKESMLTPHAIKLGDMLGQAIPEDYPFSRRSGAKPPPGKKIMDSITAEDKEELQSIIKESME